MPRKGAYGRGRKRRLLPLALLLAALTLLGALPALAAEEAEREIGGAGYAAVIYDNTSGLPT